MVPSYRRLLLPATKTACKFVGRLNAASFSSLGDQYTFQAKSASHTCHQQTFSTAASSNIQLYQYAICPFCSRVKTLLSYAGLEYQAVEVNPLTKAEIKQWSEKHKKVPIATIDEEPVFGSDEIIQHLLKHPDMVNKLEEKWKAIHSNMDMEKFQNNNDTKWTTFATEELASLLYPNMCRSLGDSYRAFAYVDNVEKFSALQRISIRGLGSLAMYMAASKVKKKRNITDERKALDDVLTTFEQDGLQTKDFISGADQPSMDDLAIFGVLRAIEGLPAHDEVVYARGGKTAEWYDRMTSQLVKS